MAAYKHTVNDSTVTAIWNKVQNTLNFPNKIEPFISSSKGYSKVHKLDGSENTYDEFCKIMLSQTNGWYAIIDITVDITLCATDNVILQNPSHMFDG